MILLTSKDLDRMDNDLHISDRYGEITSTELIQLARLGLWAHKNAEVLEALLEKESFVDRGLWYSEAKRVLESRPKVGE